MQSVTLPAALTVLTALAFARPAHSVILGGGTGAENTTPPTADPVWSNVGTVNGSTAIYLGNQYVLTANHVGAGTVNLGGTAYSPVAGSAQVLTNNGAPGVSATTDLVVFRINGDPGLSPISISTSSPATDTPVIMIGNGRNRAATPTFWDVNTATNPDTWTGVPEETLADRTGYVWAAGNALRWGTNNVADPATFIDIGVDVMAFTTVFDQGTSSELLATEAQAATNDSGGGVFINSAGTWELAGIMLAVDSFDGQPAGTSVFGNPTVIADLSAYRSQIQAILVPEPATAALAALATGLLLRRRSR